MYDSLHTMTIKRRHSRLLALCFVFLVLGTSNHCALEDLFAFLSNKIISADVSQHHPNHLGSNSKHKHGDSSESHEHGSTHPIVALVYGRGIVNVAILLSVLVPLMFISVFGIRLRFLNQPARGTLPLTIGSPLGYLRQFIFSLTSAPQAPPATA